MLFGNQFGVQAVSVERFFGRPVLGPFGWEGKSVRQARRSHSAAGIYTAVFYYYAIKTNENSFPCDY